MQFKGYGEDAVSVSSFLVHESDEKGRIREEINANIRSEYTNASIPDPSIYVETGVDAFVYEDDNMFAEDDFDEDMLSFEVDLSLMNGVTDSCACGMFFLLPEFFRACSKMKSAQWGFSFTKSNIHFLKQLCLYFNYMK